MQGGTKMNKRKTAVLVSLFSVMVVLSACERKEVMEIKIDDGVEITSIDNKTLNVTESEINEKSSKTTIEAPPIISSELKYESEFSYEDSVAGDELVKRFIQALFVLDTSKPITTVLVEMDAIIASDKIAVYKELYQTAMGEYKYMNITDVKVLDYNTQNLTVNGKDLNTLEFEVAFNVDDDVHELTPRTQYVYVVREGEQLKVFSNKNINS